MRDIIQTLNNICPISDAYTDAARITDVHISQTNSGTPFVRIELDTLKHGVISKTYNLTSEPAVQYFKKEMKVLKFIMKEWSDLEYLSDHITGSLVSVQVKDDGRTLYLRAP